MAKQHILAENGIARYKIACDFDAPAAQRHAAHELARYLSEITGIVWPIVSPSLLDGYPPIFIGFNALTPLFESEPAEPLGPEEYILHSVDAGILIAGGSPRGTLYGVYAFLEALGCRFLAQDETIVPRRETLVIEPLSLREGPAFDFRYGFYRPLLESDLSAKFRMNGACASEFYSGYEKYLSGAQHSFSSLVPPEQYFAQHPEYFSMVNGKRVPDKQLCLTNPGVFEVIYRALRKRLLDNPEHSVLSVSINDCDGGCECPDCRAVDDAEETQAASLVSLLNRLGEALEPEFPHALIGSLAYLHTRKPPKTIQPRRNVIIWLCSIECCFTHPLEECVDAYGPRMGQASFPGDLKGWTDLCPNVFIWDYVNNFSHFTQPHPNLQVLAQNIQFFKRHGVRGVFEQGHSNCTNGSPCLNELRYYLISKLLWNPQCDVAAAKREFLSGYYGPAADAVGRFISVFEEKVISDNLHMGISSPPDSDYLAPETLDLAEAALLDARKAVPETGKYARRIDRLFLLIAYPRLAVRVRDGAATQDEINCFFGEYARLGYDHTEECMDSEARRRYILEMGRMTDLINGHFRGHALVKNVT